MNVESVAGWLDALGVPPEVVSIGAEADQAWCLVPDKGEWEVYWREQGNRYDWARFTDEHVACFYLYGRLAWTQVARGAVVLAERPDSAEPAPPA